MRPSQLIVDIKCIEENIKSIERFLGPKVKIMPIVKSYGYGTHINQYSKILNRFDYVGVALLEEAIELRKNGYKNNILILYPLSKDEYKVAQKYDFILNGSNIFDIYDECTKIRIHIEIETGMGRTGLQLKNIDDYILKLKNNKNILVDGIFTHLSSNSDNIFSLKQIELFNKVIKTFNDNGYNPKNIHMSASGGLMYHNLFQYNMVRIGLLIYGYYPNEKIKKLIKVKPSVILKTIISYLKEIEKGETVGYNKMFVAKKRTKVATIPFGFADGLPTLEVGDPYVIINKQKANIIGICMDNMMLDVTNIDNVSIGDIVYIWDNKELSVEKVGAWCNGICNYEVLSFVSERVPRVFKK